MKVLRWLGLLFSHPLCAIVGHRPRNGWYYDKRIDLMLWHCERCVPKSSDVEVNELRKWLDEHVITFGPDECSDILEQARKRYAFQASRDRDGA